MIKQKWNVFIRTMLAISLLVFTSSSYADSIGQKARCSDGRVVSVVYLGAIGKPPCEVRDSSKNQRVYNAANTSGYCEEKFDLYTKVILPEKGIGCRDIQSLNTDNNSNTPDISRIREQLKSSRLKNRELLIVIKDLNTKIEMLAKKTKRQDKFNVREVQRVLSDSPPINIKVDDESGAKVNFVGWKVPGNPASYSVHADWLKDLSDYQKNVISYFFDSSAISAMRRESNEKCRGNKYCNQLYLAFMLSEVVDDQ